MQPAPSDNVLLFIYYFIIFICKMQNPEQNYFAESLIFFSYNAIIIIPGDIICSVEKRLHKCNPKINERKKVHWE